MNQMIEPGLFRPPWTFMGAPYGHDLKDRKAAIIGIPYDNGTHPSRVGARDGPRAIREASRFVRRYRPPDADFDPLVRLNLIDCGDIDLAPSMLQEAEAAIEEALSQVLRAGVIPVTMGGDGCVTFAQLRAVAALHPDLAVLHMDSHTDANAAEGRLRATGNGFYRAVQEGLVDASASVQAGMRGTQYNPGIYDATRALGYDVITWEEMREQGIEAVAAVLRDKLAGRPVYLCWDMDFFDPSCAPGVCAPIPGGPSADEGLRFLRALAGLRFAAIDVNTVSPPHDTNGITALLAAQVIYDSLVLLSSEAG